MSSAIYERLVLALDTKLLVGKIPALMQNRRSDLASIGHKLHTSLSAFIWQASFWLEYS